MKLRRRYFAAFLLVVAGGIAAKWLLFPRATIQAATTTVAPGVSYLVILGVNDTAPANWDGSITVTGAGIQILRGWRFTGTDAINGTASWKMNTRTTLALNAPGPVQENGILVKISPPASTATINITTTQGNFSFTSQDVSFGVSKAFLNGRALVTRTGTQFQLSSSLERKIFRRSHALETTYTWRTRSLSMATARWRRVRA